MLGCLSIESAISKYLYLCAQEIKISNLYAMKAKPFIKWVGGKSQLIEQLEAKLPADFDNWENVN